MVAAGLLPMAVHVISVSLPSRSTSSRASMMGLPGGTAGNPIIEARDEVLREGNETEMTCTAMGSKPAATIKWMKGDKELPAAAAAARGEQWREGKWTLAGPSIKGLSVSQEVNSFVLNQSL
ncbi:hypothetical protein CRUP_010868 [Coryphaenoides rupestris]|nr:hypothetical protein CRUP_010868 [Coryphaenoides rupestris]